MKIRFPKWLVVITFPSLLLLTGCNSEGAFNSSESAFDTSEGVLFDIEVTPNDGFVLMKHGSLQLKATGKYDDGTELDISDSVEWTVVYDTATSKVSSTGLVEGETEGEVIITASKSGIVSDDATVEIGSLAGPTIDIFDTGSGKLFTNSPSKAYLDSTGVNITEVTYEEYDPVGVFYVFNWSEANALCETYNTRSLGGRTNWRLPERDELQNELNGAFHDAFSGMFDARGWPIMIMYWSTTSVPDDPNYYSVVMGTGEEISRPSWSTLYASCVSNP